MVDYIDLHALTLEELSGVVNVYPWFGAARKLLCERMKEMGALSDNLLAQTALYVGDRSILYYMVNGRAVRDPAVDYERARRVEQERLARENGAGAAAGVGSAAAGGALDGGAAAGTGGSGDAAGSTGEAYSGGRGAGARQIFVAGGDYFSQSQYNSVKKSGDDLFARFAVSSRPEGSHEGGELPDEEQFYTETLAGIYVEQGYLAEAKKIYSKLSLRYPEKSIYFANLIDEINKN